MSKNLSEGLMLLEADCEAPPVGSSADAVRRLAMIVREAERRRRQELRALHLLKRRFLHLFPDRDADALTSSDIEKLLAIADAFIAAPENRVTVARQAHQKREQPPRHASRNI